MAINFCVQCLNTKVTSNKVCADGFEVENLLTNKANGFRVEYFVKPPIEILFTFAFPIDIRKVFCGLKVNERKTTAFQLFLGNESNDFKLCGYFETTKDNLCIINTKYRDNKHQTNCAQTTYNVRGADQNCEIFYVSRMNQKYFVKVKHLKLRLLKAEHSGICVMRCVEIYGQPNVSIATDTNVNELLKLYWKHVTPETTSESENKKKRKTFEEVATSSSKRRSDAPSDFFDPITNEVMLLPLILPSGNTIDKSTLDKYLANEASWGRLPNDPFTNIPFKKNSEPMPNSALKFRIDAYFTENHQMLPKESLPSSRIVGGYGNSSKLISSTHTPSSDKKCVACELVHPTDEAVYKLPCGHLICRKLHSEKYKHFQKSCQLCVKEYSPKHVVRYFTSV